MLDSSAAPSCTIPPDRVRAEKAKQRHKRVERGLRDLARDGRGDIYDTAYQARLRQLRDGRYGDDFEVDEDGLGGGDYIFPAEGGPEEALTRAGYDPASTEIRQAMWRACDDAQDLAGTAALHGTPWGGGREEAEAAAALYAPEQPQPNHREQSPVLASSLIPPRSPILPRRGHAPRIGSNARRRGSARRSGPSPPKSGDDPPGEPSDIDGPPLLGRLTPVLIGGGR